jgi:hypothetical protein
MNKLELKFASYGYQRCMAGLVNVVDIARYWIIRFVVMKD